MGGLASEGQGMRQNAALEAAHGNAGSVRLPAQRI